MGLNIGITGGIGSGKTLICRIFSVLGIPIYDADKEAKALMQTDSQLLRDLKAAFGENVYDESGVLDRKYLASMVFDNQEQLDLLNSIVHPVVIRAGEQWMYAQTGPYSVKEAALLFESGSYQANDYNILVIAPIDQRIERVMKRDGVNREQVQARIEKQMSDQEKEKLADFIIYNDGRQAVLPQVLALHERFVREA